MINIINLKKNIINDIFMNEQNENLMSAKNQFPSQEEIINNNNNKKNNMNKSNSNSTTNTFNSYNKYRSQEIKTFSKNNTLINNIRNIFGNSIKKDDWIKLLNIGNIMYLSALNYEDLDLDSDPKYELLRDAIIEKILMLTVSFFSIANELRFLGNKVDNGLYYHSKTVEISCLYLPSTCPIVKHYVNTYCKYYGNGNLQIDLDKESKIDQEKYDVTKDKILYMENNDVINIIEKKNVPMDNNYFLNMNNVRNDVVDNKLKFKQAKTDRRNNDSKLSLTVRNPKNINFISKKSGQNNRKNNSRPSTHRPKKTKTSLNNVNNNNNSNNNFTFNNSQALYKGIDIYPNKMGKNQFKTVQQKDDIFNFKK